MFADQVGFYLEQASTDAEASVPVPPAPAPPAEDMAVIEAEEELPAVVAVEEELPPAPVEEVIPPPFPVQHPGLAARLRDLGDGATNVRVLIVPSLAASWPESRLEGELSLWRSRWAPPEEPEELAPSPIEETPAVVAVLEEAPAVVAVFEEKPAVLAIEEETPAIVEEPALPPAMTLPSLWASWPVSRLREALSVWCSRWASPPAVIEDVPAVEEIRAAVEENPAAVGADLQVGPEVIADEEEPWVAVAIDELDEPIAVHAAPVAAPVIELVEDDVWVLPPIAELDQLVVIQPPVQMVQMVQAVQEVPVPVPVHVQEAPKPAPASRKKAARPKKAKPVQDEWGFFDPEQCGFAALLAKLDEITEDEDVDEQDADTTVRLIAY